MGKQVDKCVIRRFKEGDVIALFFEQSEGPGMCNSYQHIGQHGAASLRLVRETRPVPTEHPDAVELLDELRRIGYNPRVMQRIQRP